MKEEAQDQLERAKRIWEDKTSETDRKIKIRENQLKLKNIDNSALRTENANLKKMLEEADGRLEGQRNR